MEKSSRTTIYYCLAYKLLTTEDIIKNRIIDYLNQHENEELFRTTIYPSNELLPTSTSVDSLRSSLFQMFKGEIEVGECRYETLSFLMKHIKFIFQEIEVIFFEYGKNNILPVPENSYITVKCGNQDLSSYDFYDSKSTAILYYADRSYHIQYRLLSAMPLTLENSS